MLLGKKMESAKKKYSEFGFVFWLHLSLILLFWLLPFLVAWKFVLLSVFIFYAQLAVMGPCILTKIQFQTRDPSASFYHHYLTEHLGLNLSRKRVESFVVKVVPWIIFLMSTIWQILLKKKPLIF